MDESFNRYFEQGNRTIDIVQEILCRAFIKIADMERDLHGNTDLVWETPFGEVEVSVRIRTFKWFKEEYKYDFTLCCHRYHGGDAEWQKIFGNCKDGKEHGHYFFYGFESEDGKNIIWWFIGDFDALRKWWREGKKGFESTSDDPKIGDIKINGERVGECTKVRRREDYSGERYYDYLYIFDRRKIPGFVLRSSEDEEVKE